MAREQQAGAFDKPIRRVIWRSESARAKRSATGVKHDRPLGSHGHHSMAGQRAIAASAKLKQCASHRIARRGVKVR